MLEELSALPVGQEFQSSNTKYTDSQRRALSVVLIWVSSNLNRAKNYSLNFWLMKTASYGQYPIASLLLSFWSNPSQLKKEKEKKIRYPFWKYIHRTESLLWTFSSMNNAFNYFRGKKCLACNLDSKMKMRRLKI